VNECLRLRIEAIQGLFAADPQRAVAILEQRLDHHAAEAVSILPIVHKDFERISVEAVQSS
jgi:hypothetical protein